MPYVNPDNVMRGVINGGPAVYFCRTRHNYQSYTDFWKLVELAGYPVIYVDQIDTQSDNTYIFTPAGCPGETDGGSLEQRLYGKRCRVILWELEWEVRTPNLLKGVDEVWCSDRWYAEKITGANPPFKVQFVPLGSDARLQNAPAVKLKREYDVALLAYVNHRRANVINQMKELGLRLAPNGWGIERDTALKQSGAMVQIHQSDGRNTLTPLRVAVAAAYSLPYITETVEDIAPLGYGDILISDLQNLPKFVWNWTRQNEQHILWDFGRSLHNKLCRDLTFKKCVEGAL